MTILLNLIFKECLGEILDTYKINIRQFFHLSGVRILNILMLFDFYMLCLEPHPIKCFIKILSIMLLACQSIL